MERRINWFGLAAGIITLVVLAVSLFLPWWQLTIGDKLIQVNASPINTNFGLLRLQFTIPLIWAWNVATILTFVAAGIVMLIYSVAPTKSYAKELLGFSYKKPIYALLGFVVGLIVIVAIAGALGVGVPVMGSSNIALPAQFMPSGLSISVLVSSSFQLPFWLAVSAAALCIVARLYHRRIAKAQLVAPATVALPTEAPAIS